MDIVKNCPKCGSRLIEGTNDYWFCSGSGDGKCDFPITHRSQLLKPLQPNPVMKLRKFWAALAAGLANAAKELD